MIAQVEGNSRSLTAEAHSGTDHKQADGEMPIEQVQLGRDASYSHDVQGGATR